MSIRTAGYLRVLLDPRDEEGNPVEPSPSIAALSPSARHLAEVLSSYANAQGEAWPSIAALAERMRRSGRTVQRARAELVAAGVIAADTVGGRVTTRYRFPVVDPITPVPALSTGVTPVSPVHVFGGDTRVTPGATPVSSGSTNEGVRHTSSDAVPRAAPPWIAEGIAYGTWVATQRAAGKVPKHNPPRPRAGAR